MLKNQIAYAIEQITLQGIHMKSFGSTTNEFQAKNDLNSHNGLLKEYKKLAIQLKQLQVIEKRTNTQLNGLLEEENDIATDINQLSNLQSLRSEAANNMEQLTNNLDELMKKKSVTEGVVKESLKRTQDIKEHLRSNETYRQISHLEEKLTDLIKESKVLQESVNESRQEYDYSEVKHEAEATLAKFMDLLNSQNNNTRNY